MDIPLHFTLFPLSDFSHALNSTWEGVCGGSVAIQITKGHPDFTIQSFDDF